MPPDESIQKRRALVCGVTGQDGAYLARNLLDRGYEVFGTSRDALAANTQNLRQLQVDTRIRLVSMAPLDFRSVLRTLQLANPDEIYSLAGQTSVGLSFDQPVEAIESIAIGTLNLLEAIRFSGKSIRLFNAGSSECFGDTNGVPASEETPFRPRSPYAVAKVCSHNLVENYRQAYGIFACTGILFNHESPLRPERFVTQKIIKTAARIALGQPVELKLGNLDIWRDWGWSPEYVDVMHRLLQQEIPRDYVIATGRSVSLEYFVERAFAYFSLDWRDHVKQDSALFRPSDIRHGPADPALAARELGWKAAHDADFVVESMCEAARASISSALAVGRVRQ